MKPLKLKRRNQDQRNLAESGNPTKTTKKRVLASDHIDKTKTMKKMVLRKGGKKCTWSSLVLGQPLQEVQLTHKTSLPVSICTLNSLGGVPSLTFV